ncbi:MAG: patatin-like phospholipase family protein [Pseudomonadota bacterium]
MLRKAIYLHSKLFKKMNRVYSITTLFFILAYAAFTLSGCSFPARKHAVPQASTEKAEIVGLPGVRYEVDTEMPAFTQDMIESFYREQRFLTDQVQNGQLPPANFLAISGGGDNGAFGAGLLCGWTSAGNRPEFKAVTGISTGALIAPFAFLGPEYDSILREVYTTISPKDVLKERGILAAVFEDAMADNAPLRRLIQHYITKDILQEISRQHERGRLLLIMTTNLDARKSVIWNMGKIAASGHPEALQLFHNIMLASAAIPVAFPPVMFDVEVNGKQYQEMHVDGGTMKQVFLYPPALRARAISEQGGVFREKNLYLIRNARLDPDWAEVERRTYSIAARAITSLIQTQGIGDLYQIYAETQRDGIDYNLAYIPKSFNAPHKEDFDTEYMKKLFQTGYDLAVDGYQWEKAPPGL